MSENRTKAGNMCAYINCDRTRRNSANLKMFRFPVKDLGRMRKWIVNSGNVTLVDREIREIYKKYLCEYHFTDSDYINPDTKSRLKLTSVPQPFCVESTIDQEIHPTRTETSRGSSVKKYPGLARGVKRQLSDDSSEDASSGSDSFLKNVINMPSSPKRKCIPLDPTLALKAIIKKQKEEIELLRKKIEVKNKKISLQGSQIWKLQRKLRTTMNRLKTIMPIGQKQ